MSVFSTEVRAFSPEEVQFVKAVAQLLGPTFARDKAEKALAEQSQFSDISNELHEYLSQWLVNHIQGTDRQYIDCFKKNGLI